MEKNFQKILNIVNSSTFDGIVLNPGPTMEYITGLRFHLMERPVLLFILKNKNPIFFLPELEKGKLANLPFEHQSVTYTDDHHSIGRSIEKVKNILKAEKATLGIESTRFRFLEVELVRSAFPNITLQIADTMLKDLRISKNDQEINSVKKAVKIAEIAMIETHKSITIGKSEIEIANELTFQLIKAGSSTDLPFPPIVASGPNSANPHAAPSPRKLQSGDMVVIDWGATHSGYVSDITRTYAIDTINDELKEIYSIVKASNLAGRNAASNNVSACDIDKASRDVINKSGYGDYFIHRTGHGIGMEAHEPPYITNENQLVLQPGNLFTVEPGIYIPGMGGVRIEDDVVITEKGSVTLTSLDRELIIFK